MFKCDISASLWNILSSQADSSYLCKDTFKDMTDNTSYGQTRSESAEERRLIDERGCVLCRGVKVDALRFYILVSMTTTTIIIIISIKCFCSLSLTCSTLHPQYVLCCFMLICRFVWVEQLRVLNPVMNEEYHSNKSSFRCRSAFPPTCTLCTTLLSSWSRRTSWECI